MLGFSGERRVELGVHGIKEDELTPVRRMDSAFSVKCEKKLSAERVGVPRMKDV